MKHKTWLEVALNGSWTRALQKRIPVTVDEIIADGVDCVRAGAAIVHLHAYDAALGRQRDDPDIYARIIEGIREQVDAIVYPTIDAHVPPGSEMSVTGKARYAAVEALAARGLLEWSVVDPGTVTTTAFQAIAHDRPGSIYLNPESDVRYGLELAAQHGFHPSYAIYEPGFVRLGAALAKRYPALKPPVYRLMFSDGIAFGFPPRRYALDAYLALMAEAAPGAQWMIAGLMTDLAPIIDATVVNGGHVRAGLEDAPLGTDRSNAQLVEEAAERIARAGGHLANAAEIRAALAAELPPLRQLA